MQRAIRHQQSSELLLSAIKENPPLNKHQRLEIYQEAYKIRLVECLQEDFTETAQKLGMVAFEEAVDGYIREVSPRCTQLAEYSEGFVEYVGIKYPPLYETASKEWMEILSWRAFEPEDKLSLEEMQNNVPYLLKIHPSLKTKKLEAVSKMVETSLSSSAPPCDFREGSLSRDVLDASSEPFLRPLLFNKILVSHRSHEKIHFFEVNKKQFACLNFFSEAQSLESLCEFIEVQQAQIVSEESLEQGSKPSEEEDMIMLVQQWIQSGVIYCIRLQP